MNLFSNNSKSSSQSNSKINAPRRSVFVDSPKKNMIIPTLKQINNDITKTFLDSRIEKVKKVTYMKKAIRESQIKKVFEKNISNYTSNNTSNNTINNTSNKTNFDYFA